MGGVVSTLQPAGDWILVRRPTPRSPGGIVLQRDPNPHTPKRVTVLAVGPGRMSETGVEIKPDAVVGEELLVGTAGIMVEEHDDGSQDWVIKQTEILARVL